MQWIDFTINRNVNNVYILCKKIADYIHMYLLNYFILCKLKGNLHT